MAWVTSSFSGADLIKDDGEKSRFKRPRKPTSRSNKRQTLHDIGTELWVDLHRPTVRDDLAVHKKKIQEVESWIVGSMAGMKGREFLLLTGPPGCGKTQCTQVLATEAGLNVLEWVNPTSTPFISRNEEDSYDPVNTVIETSISTKFCDFFTRAVKYKSICGVNLKSGNKNLVLVEDFPNNILRNPTELHHILRKYNGRCTNPVVFIVADSPSRQNNVKNLFPPELLGELSIINIMFNPVAVSFIARALSRIVTIESFKGLTLPSKDSLQQFADGSNGDVRSAVNALQFACCRDVNNLSDLFANSSSSVKTKSKKSKLKSEGTKKTSNKNDDVVAIGAKDPTILMFRALGKVLYCKREDVSEVKETLPKHLKHHERLPLIENAECIYDHSTLTSNSFSLFLHQNCPLFLNDINRLSSAFDSFTDADVIGSCWKGKEKLETYAACLSIRGVMYNTTKSSASERKWKPLTKPQWYHSNKLSSQRTSELQNLTSLNPQTVKELTTSIIPYSAHIKHSSGHPLYRQIGKFNLIGTTNVIGEGLSEMDIDNDSFSSEVDHFKHTQKNENENFESSEINEEDPEEDFLIEEFED